MNPRNITGMTHREKQIVGYASIAHGSNHAIDLTFAAVLGVLILEFHSSLVVLGLIATFSSLAFGITGLPGGFLADRIGSKRTIVLCLYLSAGTAVMVAASPNIWLLGVSLTFMGLAAGLYHPAGLAFITRGVRQRSKALGYHGVAGNMGNFLAPVLATAMVGMFNWRAAFLLMALISLGAAVSMQRSHLKDHKVISTSNDLMEGHDTETPVRWNKQLYLLPLIAVLGVNIIEGFIYRAIFTYLPLHFQENLHMEIFGLTPEVIGGMVTGIALFFGAIGQYAGGLLGEKYPRESVLLPMAIVMVPTLSIIGFTDGFLLIMAASVFILFNFMAQPSYGALIADYTPLHAQGRMFGITFALSMGIGSLGGVFGGWIAEAYGLTWVFPAIGLLTLAMVGLSVYIFLAAKTRTRLMANALH